MTELNIQHLAVAYRKLVLWFGFQLLLGILLTLGSPLLGRLPAALRGLPALGTLLALAYFAYATAKALGSAYAWLWAVAMFLPCVNIITLLSLSSRATALCRANGIEVGFLGPRV